MKRGESGICEQNDKILSMLSEDYPPEPSCKEIENERPICDYAGKAANSWSNGCLVLPGYLRQKVFPTESFQSRRKIRRFKPRYFVGYTNIIFAKKMP